MNKKFLIILLSIVFPMNWNLLFLKNIKADEIKNLINSSDLKYDQKDYKGALKEINKAIKKDPNSLNAFWKRGFIKRELKDFKGALSDFDIVSKGNPFFPAAYLIKADIYNFDLKDYDKALSAYNRGIVADPSDKDAFTSRGFLKKKMNDNKGACNDFKESVDLGDDKNSLQWINGKNDSYCMKYFPINTIPEEPSEDLSKYDIEQFQKFEVKNSCLEQTGEFTPEQSNLRRLRYKNHQIFSFKRLSQLDFNYLTKSEKSINKINEMIEKDGGCPKIVSDLKEDYNGSQRWAEYTSENFQRKTWEEAKANSLRPPKLTFYDDAQYHPDYSREDTQELIKSVQFKNKKKWGNQLTVNKSAKGLKRKRNIFQQALQLCKINKWTGYPTRTRRLGCKELFKYDADLYFLKYRHIKEQINPKKEPIEEFDFTYLVDCAKNTQLMANVSHKGKAWTSGYGLWEPIESKSRFKNLCSDFNLK